MIKTTSLLALGVLLTTAGCSSMLTIKQAKAQCDEELARAQSTSADSCIQDLKNEYDTWLEKYCFRAIGDATMYARATHNKTFRIPAECSDFMKNSPIAERPK